MALWNEIEEMPRPNIPTGIFQYHTENENKSSTVPFVELEVSFYYLSISCDEYIYYYLACSPFPHLYTKDLTRVNRGLIGQLRAYEAELEKLRGNKNAEIIVSDYLCLN